MSQTKASLSIAIIAKDAERTIGACLDSIVPYVMETVVCVDSRSQDKTPSVAKQHGASGAIYTHLQVSSWHDCPEHGHVLAQHFANARNISFSRTRTDTEFIGWVDSDDVLRGGEKLAGILAELPSQVAGIWLPYHYSHTPSGATATLFHRERILRRSVGWHWEHRVHEIAVPNEGKTEHLAWASTDQVDVWHQGEGHDTSGSARRNILLLEIEMEEEPQHEMRSLFYLGNQYFALSEWQAAIQYYERSLATDNQYQRWQSQLYLSMAYERLGNLEAAKHYAYAALDTIPYHPEPYYRLAAVAMYEKDAQRCAFWTQAIGDRMPDAPHFAFKNPLDRTYNARLCLAQAYMNNGQVSRARTEMERAASVVPEPSVVENISVLKKLEQETQKAEAYVQVLQGMDGALLTLPIPSEVWKFGRIRDVVVPAMLKARPNTQPRIIFWCGRSVEPWAPPSINTTGIGGSETAVIEIAKRFAKDGWRVDIYNEPDKYEGVYEEVGYWGLARLTGSGAERGEVLVSWRNPSVLNLPIEHKVSLLWCHDLNRGPTEDDLMGRFSAVLGVSQWHASYLSQVYGLKNTSFVPNGINLERFSQSTKKVPFRCVYASSPDRGLPNLLRMWRDIVAAESTAELHIAYGWETIDSSIAHGFDQRGQLAVLKAETVKLMEKTPGIVWRGRLPQDELAKLYQESYCWLYPTQFLEVSCISAMEAMAAGCVPVTSAAGALPETIGDAGIIVTGNTYTQAWKEFWVQCAKGVLLSPEVRQPLLAKGRERAKLLTWDDSYEHHWKPLVAGMLEDRKEVSIAIT